MFMVPQAGMGWNDDRSCARHIAGHQAMRGNGEGAGINASGSILPDINATLEWARAPQGGLNALLLFIDYRIRIGG